MAQSVLISSGQGLCTLFEAPDVPNAQINLGRQCQRDQHPDRENHRRPSPRQFRRKRRLRVFPVPRLISAWRRFKGGSLARLPRIGLLRIVRLRGLKPHPCGARTIGRFPDLGPGQREYDHQRGRPDHVPCPGVQPPHEVQQARDRKRHDQALPESVERGGHRHPGNGIEKIIGRQHTPSPNRCLPPFVSGARERRRRPLHSRECSAPASPANC